jgi:hypothetical protein
MSLYSVLLYVHVLGAMGYVSGTIFSLLGLFALRNARRVEQARSILGLVERSGQVSGISLLILLVAGLLMTITTWGWQTGWIDVTLGTLVLLFGSGALMGIRRHRITVLIKDMPDGPIPGDIEQMMYDPWMGMGIYLLVTLLLGIIFLMTVKPGLSGSLLVIGISILLGLGVSLLDRNRTKPVGEMSNPTERIGRI